jgi:hypothetical protein
MGFCGERGGNGKIYRGEVNLWVREFPALTRRMRPTNIIGSYIEVMLLTRQYLYASPLLPACAYTFVVCFRVDGFEITVLKLLLFALWRCIYICIYIYNVYFLHISCFFCFSFHLFLFSSSSQHSNP